MLIMPGLGLNMAYALQNANVTVNQKSQIQFLGEPKKLETFIYYILQHYN